VGKRIVHLRNAAKSEKVISFNIANPSIFRTSEISEIWWRSSQLVKTICRTSPEETTSYKTAPYYSSLSFSSRNQFDTAVTNSAANSTENSVWLQNTDCSATIILILFITVWPYHQITGHNLYGYSSIAQPNRVLYRSFVTV